MPVNEATGLTPEMGITDEMMARISILEDRARDASG